MKRFAAWTLLPLFPLLAGCPGDDDPQQVAVGDTLVSVTTPAGQGMEDRMAGMPHGEMGAVVQLTPLQDSGVAGEVTVTPQGNETQVMVRLTGGTPGGNHPGHVHSGTCANIGGVVQALQPISTDGTGTGTMTTTVGIPPMTLMNGQHVIVYHGDGGRPVTCGEVPAHAM
jgi:hypothetical protein